MVMEELIKNLPAVYIIACIAVITYTNFKENQHIFIIYLFTYATVFFKVFDMKTGLILLLIVTFAFLEYLTADSKKLFIITKLLYKIGDYLFMMFFQYSFVPIIISLLMLRYSEESFAYSMISPLLKTLSLIFLLTGLHFTISQPFKIKSIEEICKVFDRSPPYMFKYDEAMQPKFDMLCAFEDKTYFQRRNSYSCVSLEYVSCVIKKRGFYSISAIKSAIPHIIFPKRALSALKRFFSRGHSTPEMQLLRTIGIVRGYDDYILERKIFEVVYSKIYFDSLKKYYKDNGNIGFGHYRHYLLYIYLQNVVTQIKRVNYSPFCSLFEGKISTLAQWDMEQLFIACLGLGWREVNDRNLDRYGWIIEAFGLDRESIKRKNSLFDGSFHEEEFVYTLP